MLRCLTTGLALSLLAAPPAAAETFVDLFAGRSFPERTAAAITATEARINGVVVPADLRIDIERLEPTNSTIFGARVGHWFTWFGVALDAATLNPDVKRQTIRATANLRFDERVFGEPVVIDTGAARAVDIPRITVPTTATVAALALVRLPRAGIEPYAYAGPVYLVTDSDLGGDWGVRVGGGTSLPLSRRLALFAEYRYTGVDNARAVAGEFEGSTSGITGESGAIRVALDVRNHSGVGGLRFRF